MIILVKMESFKRLFILFTIDTLRLKIIYLYFIQGYSHFNYFLKFPRGCLFLTIICNSALSAGPWEVREFDRDIFSSVSLDTHVHLRARFSRFSTEESLFLNLTEIMAKTSSVMFLISPSYRITKEPVDWAIYDEDRLLENRHKHNKLTAKFTQYFPTRLRGLCGMNLHWSDFSETLDSCLEEKGMIGLKLRMKSIDYEKRLFKEPYRNRFEEAMEKNKKNVKVVLIHTSINEYNRYRDANRPEVFRKSLIDDEKEIKAISQLAKDYPSVQFIIAHGMNSPKHINLLAAEIRKFKIENLYLEFSFALKMSELKRGSIDQMAEALKNFGFNRLLFGSDMAIPNSVNKSGFGGETVKESLELLTEELYFLYQTSFTNLVKKQIIYQNGIDLLKKIDEQP